MKKILLLLLIFVSGCTGVVAQQFDYGKIAPHPRLLLPAGGEEAIRKAIAEYPPLATVHQRIMELCDRTLTEPPVERIKEGKRLLAISRIALKRIYYLSYAYRMTGDKKYAHRAEQEMLAVSRFTDWNPTHFLDVGEMVMALAIGYDWLYDSLQPDTRRVVREAIIAKGFDAAKNTRHAWFYTAKNNWNSVCNSGLAYGALALFEEIPEVSKGTIEKCMETNPKAMVGYGPDGGYPEGFGYWGYGTSFQVMLIAALESAFGTDNGLSQAPGFMESARFMQYMTAPGGDCFCFSDSPVEAECNMMMFWFAGKAKDLSLLWIERQYLDRPDMPFAEDRLLPSLMVFCSQLDLKHIGKPKKNFWFSRGDTPVFIYRGGWDSKEDTYLGVKGGSPSTSHAHMDAGSFIFERDGVHSNDESVDPMGACVGPKGARVQNIVDELKGEKIDIIKWSKDPAEFLASALSPAKVLSVTVDEETKSAKVIVDDNQLSLAIGTPASSGARHLCFGRLSHGTRTHSRSGCRSNV